MTEEKLVWIKLYPADYHMDMLGLSLPERGAYTTLLFVYMARQTPFPDDDYHLTRLSGSMTKAEWLRVKPAVQRLFHVEQGMWRHLRLDKLIAEGLDRHRERVEAGRKGAEARWTPKVVQQGGDHE